MVTQHRENRLFPGITFNPDQDVLTYPQWADNWRKEANQLEKKLLAEESLTLADVKMIEVFSHLFKVDKLLPAIESQMISRDSIESRAKKEQFDPERIGQILQDAYIEAHNIKLDSPPRDPNPFKGQLSPPGKPEGSEFLPGQIPNPKWTEFRKANQDYQYRARERSVKSIEWELNNRSTIEQFENRLAEFKKAQEIKTEPIRIIALMKSEIEKVGSIERLIQFLNNGNHPLREQGVSLIVDKEVTSIGLTIHLDQRTLQRMEDRSVDSKTKSMERKLPNRDILYEATIDGIRYLATTHFFPMDLFKVFLNLELVLKSYYTVKFESLSGIYVFEAKKIFLKT